MTGSAAPQSERTVTLVDDHELLAFTLTAALAQTGIGCHVTSPAPPEELLAAILDAAPTIVLLDLDLGGYGSSLPLIEPLTAAGIRVIVLTAETNRIRLAETIEAGAIRVVTKTSAFGELTAALQDTIRQDAVTRDPQAADLLAELAAHRRTEAARTAELEQLTPREHETLTALAQGLTVQQIAHRWVLSETTVRSHVRSILAKLGAQSQLQAVVRAVQAGWVTTDLPDL